MATNQEIIEKLDSLLKRTEEVVKLQSAVLQIDKTVCEHDKVLYGANHDNGFVTEIPLMKDTISGIRRIGWIIVTALITGFIGGGFVIIEVVKAIK